MFARLRYAIPFAGAILALSLYVNAQNAPESANFRIETGITQPSSRKELSFANQGLIAEVAVKEGEPIKTGQLLMVQDEQIQKSRVEGLKIEADRTPLLKAREASLANKVVIAKRKKDLFDKKAISESELQEAELDVKLAEAELELAKQEGRVKQNELESQTIRLAECRMLAPTDGIVEKIVLSEGEVASIERPSIVIVKNNPLYIEVKTLPVSVVKGLKKGQELEIRYQGEQWVKAKIQLIAPVADARAGSQAIRLEMPNPEGRWTGLPVDVKIPAAVEAAAR